MIALSLAWCQLRSQWAAGEVRALFFALVLAVAATTAVGFFTDRIASALLRQGGMLLGADGYLVMPVFDAPELLAQIKSLLPRVPMLQQSATPEEKRDAE